jgi:hypothetical protein
MRAILSLCLACAVTAFAQAIPPSRQAEGAMLSEHVYSLPLKGSGTLVTGAQLSGASAPSGYKVVGGLGNDASGFQGAIYQSDSSGRVTVVYRGTDELKDLKADADIKFGGATFQNQLSDASKLTDYAVKTYGKENVSIAGHSLGGAIAQVESARAGLSAETYNAPGMLDYIKDNKEKYPNVRVELITNHNRASDAISSVGTQPGYVRTYPSRSEQMPDVMPNPMYGDPNGAMALARVAADHAMEPFSTFFQGGGTPIDPPTLRSLDGTSKVVDQWGDGGATVRMKEFEAIARANADEARAKAAAAQSAATLSADPPAPDPMLSLLSTVLTATATAKQAPAAEAAKGGASCPKKAFSTPDGCHPGHDEKAHPGGCYCG